MRAQCIINININDLQTWFIIEQIPITVRKFTQKNHLPPIATAVLFFTNSSETGSSMCPLSNGTTQPTSIAWDPTAILNLQPHVHNWDLTYLWNRYRTSLFFERNQQCGTSRSGRSRARGLLEALAEWVR